MILFANLFCIKNSLLKYTRSSATAEKQRVTVGNYWTVLHQAISHPLIYINKKNIIYCNCWVWSRLPRNSSRKCCHAGCVCLNVKHAICTRRFVALTPAENVPELTVHMVSE